jgi:hypothetical protein
LFYEYADISRDYALGILCADSGRCRSAFRDEADHYSVLIPIRIPL